MTIEEVMTYCLCLFGVWMLIDTFITGPLKYKQHLANEELKRLREELDNV